MDPGAWMDKEWAIYGKSFHLANDALLSLSEKIFIMITLH